jgi:HEAT repeat protein
MDLQQYIQLILNQDFTAQLYTKQVGEGAQTELIKLLKHETAKVRELALVCLTDFSEPEAIKEIGKALYDSDSHVRGVAISFFRSHNLPSLYAFFLHVYDTHQDAYIRQQLMLVMGKMNEKARITDLKTRSQREVDKKAQDAGITALARLNDPDAQRVFINRLNRTSGYERADFLAYCEYIHALWLIEPLGKLLNDKSDMVRIGIDALPNFPHYLRTCDVAIRLISSITYRRFSFDVLKTMNYTDAQIEEVRRFVFPNHR